MRIVIETIPHEKQRYETVGDWQFLTNDELVIRVSELRNIICPISTAELKQCELIVGIHELIEAVLCKSFGITEKEVDEWDMSHEDSDDPGSIPGCPYYQAHSLATIIEKMLAHELGIYWEEYEEVLERL
jgi:hypothetical protein